MVKRMAKKYVCVAKHCVWRVDCGLKNAMCSRLNCPNIRIHKESLPTVKWSGLVNKKL